MARPRKRPDLTPLQKAMLVNVYENMDSYATSGEAREAAEHDKDLQPGLASKIGDDIGQMGKDAPRGYYELLKAGAADYGDATSGRSRDFRRMRNLGGGLAESLAEDFRHPLRHPGYSLMNLAVGVGAAAKVPATLGKVGRAAREAGPVVAHPKASLAKVRNPPPRDMFNPKRSVGKSLVRSFVRPYAKLAPKPKSVTAGLAFTRASSARERVREARAAKAAAQIRRSPPVRRGGR